MAPLRGVSSPVLFLIMINDVYNNVNPDIGKSLFADDGAIWKRGRNMEFVVKKVQEAVNEVEEWSLNWGFKLSVEKSQSIFLQERKSKMILV